MNRDYAVQMGTPGPDGCVTWMTILRDQPRGAAVLAADREPTRARVVCVRSGYTRLEWDNQKPLAAAEEIEDGR